MRAKYIDFNKINPEDFSITQIKEMIKVLEYLRENINKIPEYGLNPGENIQLHNLHYFLFGGDYSKYEGKGNFKIIDLSEHRITQDDIISNFIHWHIYNCGYHPEHIGDRLIALWIRCVGEIISLEGTYTLANKYDHYILISTNDLAVRKYYRNLLDPIGMI